MLIKIIPVGGFRSKCFWNFIGYFRSKFWWQFVGISKVFFLWSESVKLVWSFYTRKYENQRTQIDKIHAIVVYQPPVWRFIPTFIKTFTPDVEFSSSSGFKIEEFLLSRLPQPSSSVPVYGVLFYKNAKHFAQECWIRVRNSSP